MNPRNFYFLTLLSATAFFSFAHDSTTVKLLGREWQKSNAGLTAYTNGQEIIHAKTAAEWVDAGKQMQGAWCYFEFNEANAARGRFYNGYAADDVRGFAPKGWHIATKKEWKALADSLGKETAGQKIKDENGWSAGQNGTNETGLALKPLGYVNAMGEFLDVNKVAYVWTGTRSSLQAQTCCVFYGQSKNMGQIPLVKACGLPVRLIKD
jgi:uncharacterized protein (TIGR02145 family)